MDNNNNNNNNNMNHILHNNNHDHHHGLHLSSTTGTADQWRRQELGNQLSTGGADTADDQWRRQELANQLSSTTGTNTVDDQWRRQELANQLSTTSSNIITAQWRRQEQTNQLSTTTTINTSWVHENFSMAMEDHHHQQRRRYRQQEQITHPSFDSQVWHNYLTHNNNNENNNSSSNNNNNNNNSSSVLLSSSLSLSSSSILLSMKPSLEITKENHIEEEGDKDGEEEEEEEEEELGAMKEMMYRYAVMQPVDIDPAMIHKPKRRNVRISNDPQSVAARQRRERISEKVRILQRLVPGGTKLDTASMLDEAIRYVKFLKKQIRLLELRPSSSLTNQQAPHGVLSSGWGIVGPSLGNNPNNNNEGKEGKVEVIRDHFNNHQGVIFHNQGN